jgi:rod shape-determining protein MreB
VAIDLGTANTCIYTGGAVALSEPSVIAFNTHDGAIEAVGAQARDMLGRAPASINPVWPGPQRRHRRFRRSRKNARRTSCESEGPQLRAGARVSSASPPEAPQVERGPCRDSANRMRVSDVSLVDEADGRRHRRRLR